MMARVCIALLAALSLAACGGGGSSVAMQPAVQAATAAQLADTTFTFVIPLADSPAQTVRRSATYITAATMSIKLQLISVSGVANGTAPAPVPALPNLITNVTSTTAGCTTAGTITCIMKFPIPPGSDKIEIQTFDAQNAAGNVISQQIVTKTVTAGVANAFPNIQLDANPSTITVSSPGIGVTGSFPAFTLTVPSALTFSTTVNDAHGTVITGNTLVGSPVLQATSSDTSIATVVITQSPYAVIVTPVSTSGTATITVSAFSNQFPSDGLATSTTTFTVTPT